MTAFSEFSEERLADHSVGNSSYVVPYFISLAGSNDGDYDITVFSEGNGSTTFSYTASSDNESTILDDLEGSIDGGSHPVNAHRFNGPNGNEQLMIEQDSSETVFSVQVSSTGSSMNKNRWVFGALYFDDPTDADTGTEVSDGANSNGYTREIIDFTNATTNGLIENTSDVTFGPAGAGGWNDGGGESVSYVGIRDAFSQSPATDNLLYHGPLSSSKTITQNDSFVFRAGDLDISLE
jgi:hypothetical protein